MIPLNSGVKTTQVLSELSQRLPRGSEDRTYIYIERRRREDMGDVRMSGMRMNENEERGGLYIGEF